MTTWPGPPRWSSAGNGHPPRKPPPPGGPGRLLVLLVAVAIVIIALTAIRRAAHNSELEFTRVTPSPTCTPTPTGGRP